MEVVWVSLFYWIWGVNSLLAFRRRECLQHENQGCFGGPGDGDRVSKEREGTVWGVGAVKWGVGAGAWGHGNGDANVCARCFGRTFL